ncbi:protein STICHEL-like 2-like [Hibiscus syriacus]|uniref:Protein STICHEL-like 2-like n=1 Tax=Hibiscus syriacus TaxID=106335 RepID=A0A6A2ZT69_HIBSY|nr:protein JINGUBANG-like [Hibiscus syriacus]KAE8695050.1 protein STICHEL-like 2-like [Hibiscus syriacus]
MSSQFHSKLFSHTLEHRSIATFNTPSHHISCLAVHDYLLYAAAVNEISVFDLSNHSFMDSFNDDPTTGFVKSIAFNKGKIFTAHQDGKIRIWKMSTLSNKHRLISTLPTVKDRLLNSMLPKNYINVRRHKKKLWMEHWDTVSGLIINEAKGVMYSVSWDKSFKLWNVKTQRCIESVKAHDDAVNALVVSDDGTVYTGGADGLIRIWEVDGSERRHGLVGTLDKHKSTVNALALNDDGSALFSGGCDGSIMVWEKRDDNQVEFVESLWGHSAAILCLINVRDSFVSGSSDRTVRVWRRGKEESGFHCCLVLEGHENPVKSLVAVETSVFDGVVFICSGSLDGEIRVWEITTCSKSLK